MINAPEVTPGHWAETPACLPGFSNCLLLGDGKVLTWTLSSFRTSEATASPARLAVKDGTACWLWADVPSFKGQSCADSEHAKEQALSAVNMC